MGGADARGPHPHHSTRASPALEKNVIKSRLHRERKGWMWWKKREPLHYFPAPLLVARGVEVVRRRQAVPHGSKLLQDAQNPSGPSAKACSAVEEMRREAQMTKGVGSRGEKAGEVTGTRALRRERIKIVEANDAFACVEAWLASVVLPKVANQVPLVEGLCANQLRRLSHRMHPRPAIHDFSKGHPDKAYVMQNVRLTYTPGEKVKSPVVLQKSHHQGMMCSLRLIKAPLL